MKGLQMSIDESSCQPVQANPQAPLLTPDKYFHTNL
jgi:hypothetical protein